MLEEIDRCRTVVRMAEERLAELADDLRDLRDGARRPERAADGPLLKAQGPTIADELPGCEIEL